MDFSDHRQEVICNHPFLNFSLSLSQAGLADAFDTLPKHSLFTHEIEHAGQCVSVQALLCQENIYVYLSPTRQAKLSKEWYEVDTRNSYDIKSFCLLSDNY